MRRELAALTAAAVLLAVVGFPASAAQTLNLWYSLYFQGTHCGYSHVSSIASAWHHVKAQLDTSETKTQLTIFGATVEQDVTSASWSNPITGAPYFQSFRMESGGAVTDVTAQFTPRAVTAVLKSGADTSTKVIAVPLGQKIVVGDMDGVKSSGALKVGQQETDIEFDPITLALEKQTSRVVAVQIPVKDVRDASVHATDQIEVADSQGTATEFQDKTSVPLLIEMPANIFMVLTDQADALSADSLQASYAVNPSAGASAPSAAQEYEPSQDLAIATSVDPSGSALHDERTLTSLTVELSVRGQETKTVQINAASVPPENSDPVAALKTPATAPYLSAAPYLSVNDPSVVASALHIVGDEANSYAAAKLIHDWVYTHMKPEGTLGLPRSASDIIADRRGVCRDYAVLYTSLARAAGIPTKIDVGLVGFHGRFYYHAWASSYLGTQVGWLAIDATMPTMFVDATHIPLGEGDATTLFSLADVIGNVKVETLTSRNSL